MARGYTGSREREGRRGQETGAPGRGKGENVKRIKLWIEGSVYFERMCTHATHDNIFLRKAETLFRGLSSSDLEFFIWKNVSRKVKLTRAKECVDADVLKIVLNTFSQSEGANHSLVYS